MICHFAVLAVIVASTAEAELVANAADGFTLRNAATIPVPPATAWTALIDWRHWWSPAHSYSGTAPTLDPAAGGRLVERWPGGDVLHAIVTNAQSPKRLRPSGGFGPLQALPVGAVFDFALVPDGLGTNITTTYRVVGNAAAELDGFAGPVDAVITEGFARLTRFAVTGKPD